MYTLENEERKLLRNRIRSYAAASLFCLVFFLIYDRFSHGVRSPYMTFLFLWPFALGLLPYLLLYYVPGLRRPGKTAENFYHPGVACLTVSSLLRGIFDIAGTTSAYQQWLMAAGFGLLAAGIALYILKR